MKGIGMGVVRGIMLPMDEVCKLLAENPVTGITAEDLRRLLCFGCADEVLPEDVLERIQSTGLYGCCRRLSMDQLEQTVLSYPLLKAYSIRA